MSPARRYFLLTLLAAGGGLTAYSAHRGVRLPTLHWDPREPSMNFNLASGVAATGTDLIQTSQTSQAQTRLRAFAPEPMLSIVPTTDTQITVEINNISPMAVLETEPSNLVLTEEKVGISRFVTAKVIAGEAIRLAWKLPPMESYRFASIGDSGGDLELAWCLQRAQQLNALFLLHLGDFNYQAGDYQRSIDLFSRSNIPVYVSIGNHDFHEKGAIYGSFTREIGPLNHSFRIGKTRFINIDTAAGYVPFGSGTRGAMLEGIDTSIDIANTVAFTHCPLYDPDPERHHDIGSEGEKQWLIEHLNRLKVNTLLSGHIHIYDERIIQGINNIIVGQGLGHQDLLTNSDYSKMAIGEVDKDGKVSMSIQPLSMPLEMHCHPRTDPVKQSLKQNSQHTAMLNQVEQLCESKRLANR